MMLGFTYSYFWSAATVIYLLMRRKVDEAELGRRKAAWKAPGPRVQRGVLAKYARCVRSASEGAVTS